MTKHFQTKMNNMNLKKFMTPEQLEDWERRDQAMRIFTMLGQKGSNYHYSKLIERLYSYIDLDFVKEGLIKIYRETKSDFLKETICSIHDGTLDLSEQEVLAERFSELDSYAQELDDEYELESSNADSLPISNLKRTFKEN
jgi:hypothetical protein